LPRHSLLSRRSLGKEEGEGGWICVSATRMEFTRRGVAVICLLEQLSAPVRQESSGNVDCFATDPIPTADEDQRA